MFTPGKVVFKLGVLFFCVLALYFHAAAQPFGIMSPSGQQPSQKQILSSQNGRFVFGQISDSSKDRFMLDTRTGRLWRIAERGDLGMFLKSVLYCSPEGECTAVPVTTTSTKEKTVDKQ